MSQYNPIGYARQHRQRVQRLLVCDTPSYISRQLVAILEGMDDERITYCTGLDTLVAKLDEWERKYLLDG